MMPQASNSFLKGSLNNQEIINLLNKLVNFIQEERKRNRKSSSSSNLSFENILKQFEISYNKILKENHDIYSSHITRSYKQYKANLDDIAINYHTNSYLSFSFQLSKIFVLNSVNFIKKLQHLFENEAYILTFLKNVKIDIALLTVMEKTDIASMVPPL